MGRELVGHKYINDLSQRELPGVSASRVGFDGNDASFSWRFSEACGGILRLGAIKLI